MTAIQTTARKNKSSEVRRAELLAAAEHLFERKGLQNTSVADITAAAGVAKGTFYLYFESRDQLLAELKVQMVNEVFEKVEELYGRLGREDWWELVDLTIDAIVGHMLDRKDLIAVFAEESESEEVRKTYAACDKRLNELVAAGIQMGVDAGVYKVEDAYMTAALLHHAIEGTVLEAILYEPDFEKERILVGVKELARKALS